MIRGIRHVGIKVKNFEQSINFYREFGFKVISRQREIWDDQTIEVVKMDRYGSILELIKAEDWPNHHFAFEVGEIPWGDNINMFKEIDGVISAYMLDPDGHFIEFVKMK